MIPRCSVIMYESKKFPGRVKCSVFHTANRRKTTIPVDTLRKFWKVLMKAKFEFVSHALEKPSRETFGVATTNHGQFRLEQSLERGEFLKSVTILES